MTLKVKPWKPNAMTIYDPETFPQQAYEASANGGDIAAVAAALGVGKRTVALWRNQHPEFDEALEAGRCVGEAKLDILAKEHMVLVQEPNGPKVTFDTQLYKFTKKSAYKARESDPATIIADKDTLENPEKMKALQDLVNQLHKSEL